MKKIRWIAVLLAVLCLAGCGASYKAQLKDVPEFTQTIDPKTITLTQEDWAGIESLQQKLAALLIPLAELMEVYKDPAYDDAWYKALDEKVASFETSIEEFLSAKSTDNLVDLKLKMDIVAIRIYNSVEKIKEAAYKKDLDAGIDETEQKELEESQQAVLDYINQMGGESKIEVVSVKLGENVIGGPEITVQFKNNETVAVDAIDFYAECKNAYDQTVKGYGTRDYYAGTTQGNNVDSGATSKKWSWDMYGFDTAQSVRVAVYKYHTVDGRTVFVSQDNLQWSEWVKK